MTLRDRSQVFALRTIMVFVGPPIILWVWASTFCKDVGAAYRYAWWEAEHEWSVFMRHWRAPIIANPDEERESE